MKQLSGLDASFLYLETPEMPMHVGALNVYELPADYDGVFVDDLRRHMAERLPLAPALRRRLERMPLDLSNPAWIDAEPDLDEHVVAIHLPVGSGQAELEAQVGLLHPVLLPRDRPLWKFHVFDGLADGPAGEKRYAVYSQFHHAAVDGQAAVALAQALLDLGPEPRATAAPPSRVRKGEFGVARMLRAALSSEIQQVTALVKALPSAVGTLSKVAGRMALQAGRGALGGPPAGNQLGLAPRTRLNGTVSKRRAFAGVSLPLAELNAVRKRHRASLNDAVLAICSGALRRYFAKHGPLPRKSLVAAVPISLRAPGDGASNNQASMSLVSLGTHIADPARRLAHVMAANASMKATVGQVKNLLPTDFPSLGVPWLMQGLTALYGRVHVAERLPPLANLTISNVAGPTVPLYLAGARMLCNYPASIVVHGVALNITVQTCNESLDVGIIACAQALPEVAELAAYVETAWFEFKGLAAAPPLPALAAKKARGKAEAAPPAARKRASTPRRSATRTGAATRAAAPTRAPGRR